MATQADRTLADLAIKNQALLERLKSGFVRDYEAFFPEIEAAIGKTLTATKIQNLSELTKRQLDSLLRSLRSAQMEVYQRANDELVTKLQKTGGFVAGKEAVDLDKLRTDATMAGLDWDIPKPAATWDYVSTTPIAATGELMNPFINRITEGNVARVENAVRNGWAQGKTIADMTRQIYGTKANAYKDGLTSMNRRGVQAMVRTATQHTAMTSRINFFQENDDLVSRYTYIATLDTRTTSKCRSLDGKVFELGKGPLPPVHVGCRSSITPKLGPEFDFLEEGATRSSADGYVDAKTTYYDWLKKQSPEDIKEVLGKSRAELFRNGGLSPQEFDRYNMGRNFEPLTLEQMYLKDPEPFRRAGVTLKGVPNQADLDLLGPVPRGKPDAWFQGYLEEYRESLAAKGFQDYGNESFIEIWKALPEIGYDLDSIDSGVRKQLAEVVRTTFLPEQYIADVHWNHVLKAKDLPLKIRVSQDALEDLAGGGSLKNAHELGKTSAVSGFNPSYMKSRTATEELLFGGKRPVYGYLDTGKLTYQVEDYGPIELTLKKDQLGNTTFVVGDSIDDIWGRDRIAVPSKLTSPTLNAFHNSRLAEDFSIETFEAQIFDKVTLNQVESIQLHAPNPGLQEFLDSKKIPYTLSE